MAAPELPISAAWVRKAQSRVRERIQRLISISELVVVVAAEILMVLAVIIAGLILVRPVRVRRADVHH
jgi:hypothetical protein